MTKHDFMNKLGYKFMALPKNMNESKKLCEKLCKRHKVKRISFDDKWRNFYPDYNRCASAGDDIDCSKFSKWNYDILLFAVLHEIGHIELARACAETDDGEKEPSDHYSMSTFGCELDAWHFAVKAYLELFGENPGIKHYRFMMHSLGTYLPDYNSFDLDFKDKQFMKDVKSEMENRFWCPLTQKVII